MKIRMGVVTAAMLAVAACGWKADGTYVAQSSAMFGMVRVPIQLVVAGDQATLSEPGPFGGRGLTLQARVKDDRLILGEDNDPNPVVFHRINGGKSLQCPLCRQIGMPEIWEKVEH